jgi:hypothetical protein
MTTTTIKPPLGMVGRFFFTPTDPTTLGFMRIIAGLLIIYTHLAYCVDLKAFLGPNAWLDQNLSNRARREHPFMEAVLGWEQPQPTIIVDSQVQRRAAIVDLMRRLPESIEEREKKLRYIKMAFERTPPFNREGFDPQDYNSLPNVLYLSYKVATLSDIQVARLEAILQKEPLDLKDAPITTFPFFFYSMSASERLAVWRDLLEFNTILPPDAEQQGFIRDWFTIYPKDKQEDLLAYLTGRKKVAGKDRSLPGSPELRAEYLQFLESYGGDPREAYTRGMPIFSVWLHLTSPTAMWVMHGIILSIFVLFTLGLYTRTTSVLTWVLALNYIHRGQVFLFGQDTMQNLLLFYLMIGPSGAALSLDALRARFRAARLTMAGQRSPWAEAVLAGPQPSWLANMVIRMVQIHYCFIYGSSGLSKLKGNMWWDQTASWGTLLNPEFGLIRYRAYEWLMEMLADVRLLSALVSTGIVLFTLTLEIGWMFLIWTRLRPFLIMGSILLHTGITILMGLTMFGLFMFTLVCCYFPAALLRSRVTWPIGSGRKLTVQYDSRSPVAVKKAAMIRALDVAQQVTFNDSAKGAHEPNPTVTLTAPDGQALTGAALFKTACAELVLLRNIRVLSKLPGVWNVVALYGNR